VTSNLHVVDLRTGKEKTLLTDVVEAWYLPTGQLLHVRPDGVALTAPFDLDQLDVRGPSVPVLEGIGMKAGAGRAPLALSRSGSLVYVRGAVGIPERTIVRVSRTGTVTPFDTAWHGDFNSFALSPDGRRIAVGVQANGLNIWVKQLDRGPFTRLTFGGSDRRPLWSPDGRFVAFIRDTLSTGLVYARSADGSGKDRLMVRLDRQVQEATWSADGHWIVARTDNGSAGAGDLVGIRVGGDTTPVPLVATPLTELHPAVSPDGRWIAYTSNQSGPNEVFVRPFNDSTGGRWQVSNGGGTQPVWSPDGRQLYYVDRQARLVAAQVQIGATFALGDLTPLFDVSRFDFEDYHQSYGVTPDGRSFVFAVSNREAGGRTTPQLVWVDHWIRSLRNRLAP
jgi:hypothetical protein